MTNQDDKFHPIVLVEFTPRPGTKQVGIFNLSRSELAEKSSAALDSAMVTAQGMVKRFEEMIQTVRQQKLHEPPSQIEMEFGIKLDAEAGAFLSKAGIEAAITVKLTWQQDLKKKNA